MFLAFRKQTWELLGEPDFSSNENYDVAEYFSMLARKKNVEIKLIYPSSCILPKWSLGSQGVFGIGTFYGECDYFHLFESRVPAYERLLECVVADIVSSQPLNFREYLAIMNKSN